MYVWADRHVVHQSRSRKADWSWSKTQTVKIVGGNTHFLPTVCVFNQLQSAFLATTYQIAVQSQLLRCPLKHTFFATQTTSVVLQCSILHLEHCTVEPLLKDASEMRTLWLIRTLDYIQTLYKHIILPWNMDTSLIRTIILVPRVFVLEKSHSIKFTAYSLSSDT